MKRTEMSRLICQVVSCLCMVLAVTSCGNGGDVGAEVGNGKAEGEKATNALVAVEAPEKLTQIERLEAECRRLVVEPERNQNGKDVLLAINELCKEIRKLPKEEALPLLDRWIEMAIKQPLTYANYSTSAKLPERFFHIAFFSFMTSQSMRSDTYGHWDKMFRFFAKYTDEITAEEWTAKLRAIVDESGAGPFTNETEKARVWIKCDTLNIAAGASIDVNRRGWSGGLLANPNSGGNRHTAVKNCDGLLRGGFGPGHAKVAHGAAAHFAQLDREAVAADRYQTEFDHRNVAHWNYLLA